MKSVTVEELAGAELNDTVVIEIIEDPNSLANAILVGLSAVGIGTGIIMHGNALVIKSRLHWMAACLERKLKFGESLWRLLKKAVFAWAANILMAKSKNIKASNSLLSNVINAGKTGMGAVAFREIGRGMTGEIEALRSLDDKIPVRQLAASARELGANTVALVNNNVRKLQRLKHFSNVTKRYYSDSKEMVPLSDEQEQALVAKDIEVLISGEDSASTVSSLALAGIAFVSVGFGATGIVHAAEAKARLQAVVRELENRSSLWSNLKSSLMYFFEGGILNEVLNNRFTTKRIIDVARGKKPVEALESAGYKFLEALR